MNIRSTTRWIFLLVLLAAKAQAQTFVPIPVTGFDHDVVAESAPDAIATTDTVLDATDHIMYSQAFAASAGLGGGLPNSGQISDASNVHQYQLQPYTGPNAMTLMRGVTLPLTLVTPASYGKLSLLCFSTENASTIKVTVLFTDGSSTTYINNYSLPDWYYNTTNVVNLGYGRCKRVSTSPYTDDGAGTNPRFYFVDFALNCADQQKTVQQIYVSNITTSGFNAPFPNTVVLALSGASFNQTITQSATPATCSSPNGSATVNVSGSTGPYSITWSTTPAQIGSTAVNLAPGNYTATIINANGCTATATVTVPQQPSTVTATASATPTAVCPGGSAQLTVTSSGGTLSNYTWNPGSQSGSSISVTPGATTTYTVSGQDQYGCNYSVDVTVSVNTLPAAPTASGTSICAGSRASLAVQNPQAGNTYSWYAAASGGTPLQTGTSYQTPALNATTSYYIEVTSAEGCTQPTRTEVVVTVNQPPQAPSINGASICPGSTATLTVNNPQTGYTYNWYADASSAAAINSGTSYTTPPVPSATTYYVDAVSTQGCTSSSRGSVTVSMLQPLSPPNVVIGTITASSLSFTWAAVPGATGYEVTIDGGLTFTPPSSGPTGTSHEITGLIPGQSITIQVRALGVETCENSILSAPVSAFVPDKNLFVPNVFTPNGDGKNDILKVFSNSVATMDFRIFNQWGQEIFYSMTPSRGWDGTYLGKPQPVGIYVYALKAVLSDGTVIRKKGSISLLR